MEDIYSYSNFIEYIQDYIRETKEKRPSFSLREFASRAGMSGHSYLSRILKGAKKLSEKSALSISQAMDFDKNQQSFFLELVRYNQSDSVAKQDQHFQKMQKLIPARMKVLKHNEQLEFYSQWYHAAIFAALASMDFKTPGEIADFIRPRISVEKVEQSIKLQCSMGIIQELEEGGYQPTFEQISSGPFKNRAAAEHNRQVMELALNAHENYPQKSRDVLGNTLSLSQNGYTEMKKLIKKFRQDAVKISIQDSFEDRVMQMNLQFFPLSQLPEE